MSEFNKIKCPICEQDISVGGAAYTSHLRSHVRKGEAMEYKSGDHLTFIPAKEHSKFIEEHPYAKLGEEPLPGQPKCVWIINNLKVELPAIDPSKYFITSGEAVKKAEKLVKDVYSLAVKTRAFRDKLKKARGLKKYLEATHENGRLLVKSKDKRVRAENETDDEITKEAD